MISSQLQNGENMFSNDVESVCEILFLEQFVLAVCTQKNKSCKRRVIRGFGELMIKERNAFTCQAYTLK
jgi:hypothetical protein